MDDAAQLEGEALERRKAAGFQIEMTEFEPPAVALATAVLAHDAVKPPVISAGKRKIVRVDRQDQRVVKDGIVEPVWYDQLNTGWSAMGIDPLNPFVDPGKAMPPTFAGLADGRCDCRGLQAVQGRLQALIVARTHTAPDEGQNFVGRRGNQARCAQARVWLAAQIRISASQIVAIPCSATASTRMTTPAIA